MTAQSLRPDGIGSRTMTLSPAVTDTEAGPSSISPPESRVATPADVGVLRLRGGPVRSQRVVWAEGTVDNEGMGKKKSKICCIYHKPRAFDESSSESGDSSDDDHDHDRDHNHDHDRGNVLGKGKGTQKCARRDHGGQVESSASDSSESEGGGGDGRARPARRPKHRKVKPNKYDVQPSSGHGDHKAKGK